MGGGVSYKLRLLPNKTGGVCGTTKTGSARSLIEKAGSQTSSEHDGSESLRRRSLPECARESQSPHTRDRDNRSTRRIPSAIHGVTDHVPGFACVDELAAFSTAITARVLGIYQSLVRYGLTFLNELFGFPYHALRSFVQIGFA